ncbi:MAG: hypothetical protein H0X29_11065, partial [Parachlamydiaceae bacterium]|nr:hypothetical protein [Parachlamydiaceae bacterium]
RSDFIKDSGAGVHQLEKMNGQVTIQKLSVGPSVDKGSAQSVRQFDRDTLDPQIFDTPREFFEAMKAEVGSVKSSDILTGYDIKFQESGKSTKVNIYDLNTRSDFIKDSGAGVHQLEKMNGQVTIQKQQAVKVHLPPEEKI